MNAANDFEKVFFKLMINSVYGKTIPNLGNKTNYVVHYRNLHLYLSLGMKWFWKINDQFCLRKNDGKFTKKNQCEISK